MEAKMGRFFESVGNFFIGGNNIPWRNRDIIALSTPEHPPLSDSIQILSVLMSGCGIPRRIGGGFESTLKFGPKAMCSGYPYNYSVKKLLYQFTVLNYPVNKSVLQRYPVNHPPSDRAGARSMLLGVRTTGAARVLVAGQPPCRGRVANARIWPDDREQGRWQRSRSPRVASLLHASRSPSSDLARRRAWQGCSTTLCIGRLCSAPSPSSSSKAAAAGEICGRPLGSSSPRWPWPWAAAAAP
ncbi:unnamed protein product [Urochloa humidicola]